MFPRVDNQQTAEELLAARLLYLQGHSGPVDAAFGRWFYLSLCRGIEPRP